MRVLLQTSGQLAPPTNASVKAAPWEEGEQPCASFDHLTGKRESTVFPTKTQLMAETDRSNTRHVWNLGTGFVSLPQLYRDATWRMSVSRRMPNVTPFTCIGELWPPQALIFTTLAAARSPCVMFCMGFQWNRSTSMERKSRNIVSPICKLRAHYTHT